MDSKKKSSLMLLAFALVFSGRVSAQSGITLYGILDDAIMYVNNQSTLGSNSGGKSNVLMSSGTWAGSRFGLRGTEDLGNGYQALFLLENGFSTNTGAALQGGLMFGRQAYVGLTNKNYGTLTAGRQYTPYFTLLTPYLPTKWLGMHPGDIDGFDYNYRANSSLVYMSPNLGGVTFGASYAFAGIPDSVNQGSTWSGGIQYEAGQFGLGAGFVRINNSTPGGGAYGANSTTYSGGQVGVSTLTNGYQTAQAQQRFALAGTYRFNSAWDVSLTYSNVQYIPGVNSKYRDTAIFNTEGVVLHWKPSGAWDLATGYSYTRTAKANGIGDEATYHQIHLTEYYALSKRTGLYGYQAYQHASGKTLGTNGSTKVINATAAIGDYFQATPSSSRNQFAVAVGVIHRF